MRQIGLPVRPLVVLLRRCLAGQIVFRPVDKEHVIRRVLQIAGTAQIPQRRASVFPRANGSVDLGQRQHMHVQLLRDLLQVIGHLSQPDMRALAPAPHQLDVVEHQELETLEAPIGVHLPLQFLAFGKDRRHIAHTVRENLKRQALQFLCRPNDLAPSVFAHLPVIGFVRHRRHRTVDPVGKILLGHFESDKANTIPSSGCSQSYGKSHSCFSHRCGSAKERVSFGVERNDLIKRPHARWDT